MSRGHKPKSEDIRLTHAHIYRNLFHNLPPAILQTNQVCVRFRLAKFIEPIQHRVKVLWPLLSSDTNLLLQQMLRGKLVQFVAETARYINMTPELSPELQQLRHCLSTVARQCAVQLADALPQDFNADTRRTLYDMFSSYCEEGSPGKNLG